MSAYIRLCYNVASYGLNCEALRTWFINNLLSEQLATHHSNFHGSDCLVLGVMRHIGGTMEHIINSVSSVCSDRRAAVCPSNRFTGNRHVSLEARIDSQSCTHMTFPISRISAPGLQTLIDSSRHFLAVRISRSESSSIRPTGYVSFKSPWKPGISNIISRWENDTQYLTVIVQCYVLRGI
jgi:hypothetical protein